MDFKFGSYTLTSTTSDSAINEYNRSINKVFTIGNSEKILLLRTDQALQGQDEKVSQVTITDPSGYKYNPIRLKNRINIYYELSRTGSTNDGSYSFSFSFNKWNSRFPLDNNYIFWLTDTVMDKGISNLKYEAPVFSALMPSGVASGSFGAVNNTTGQHIYSAYVSGSSKMANEGNDFVVYYADDTRQLDDQIGCFTNKKATSYGFKNSYIGKVPDPSDDSVSRKVHRYDSLNSAWYSDDTSARSSYFGYSSDGAWGIIGYRRSRVSATGITSKGVIRQTYDYSTHLFSNSVSASVSMNCLRINSIKTLGSRTLSFTRVRNVKLNTVPNVPGRYVVDGSETNSGEKVISIWI